MNIEKKTNNDYWAEVQRYFGMGDTLKEVPGYSYTDEEEYRDYVKNWEDYDEIIEFRNSCGCLLSAFNVDKEEVFYL